MTAQGAGGPIPDATCCDSNGNVINSVTQFDLNFPTPGIVPPGYTVQLTLLGFQYSYAADLIVNLTFQPSGGPAISGDVFNQLGVSPDNPAGFGPIFGGAGTHGGNYVFDSDPSLSPADLWAMASSLGTSDSIPEGTYFPITAIATPPYYVPSSLSALFTGVDVSAGTWILTITNDDPNSPVPYTGWQNGFIGWELDVNVDGDPVTIPEPSYGAIGGVVLAGALLVYRRRSRTVAL